MASARANKIAREFRKIKEFTKVLAPVREDRGRFGAYDVIELVFHSAWYNNEKIEERYLIKVPVSGIRDYIYVEGPHSGMIQDIRKKAQSVDW